MLPVSFINTRIEKQTFQKYAPPITFVALAYFAGTKRFVKYFPDTKRIGLLSCAAVSGALAHVVASWPVHGRQENDRARRAFTVASIAFGTLVMPFAAKKIYHISTPNRGYGRLFIVQVVGFAALELAGLLFLKNSVEPPAYNPASPRPPSDGPDRAVVKDDDADSQSTKEEAHESKEANRSNSASDNETEETDNTESPTAKSYEILTSNPQD